MINQCNVVLSFILNIVQSHNMYDCAFIIRMKKYLLSVVIVLLSFKIA